MSTGERIAVRCSWPLPRLIQTPGHIWRELNEAQAEAERRVRPRPSAAEVRDRAVRTQTATLRMLDSLMPEDFGQYGAHPARGAIGAPECIQQIAASDRQHTMELGGMLAILRRERN